MSNLVLSRKAGQSIRFQIGEGFFLYLEVQEVNFDKGIRFRLSAAPVGETTSLERIEVVRMGRKLEIVEGLAVTVAAVAFKQVRLMIEAPLNVKILRTELVT